MAGAWQVSHCLDHVCGNLGDILKMPSDVSRTSLPPSVHPSASTSSSCPPTGPQGPVISKLYMNKLQALFQAPARRLVLCRLFGMLPAAGGLCAPKPFIGFHGDVLEITSPSRPVT